MAKPGVNHILSGLGFPVLVRVTGYWGVSVTASRLIAKCQRLALAFAIALGLMLPPATIPAQAGAGDRTLYLYHTHTQETGRFTFKRNGQYDQAVLRQLNVFLADWRTKEPTKMDPALFDLLWTVYQEVGASQPINIVSSYRAPATNAALRKKSSGVAENSQHMKGKAIDFFIPGIKLSVLRETVMRHQVGGIGYYPTSGSPFVHADTGSVRAWPRMTRAQLKQVFPDGRTLHVPTDGKPLSNEGRAFAEAEWKKCHAVPCKGSPITGGPVVMVASANEQAPVPANKPRTLMDMFFAGDQQPAPTQVAAIGGDPGQRIVTTIDITPPVPALRGGIEVAADGSAPIPAQKSQRLMLATLGAPADGNGTALAALDALGTPQPRVLMTAQPDVMAAYAPANPEPGAEKALQMIIERETTASLAPPKQLELNGAIVSASFGPAPTRRSPLGGMFEETFAALGKTKAPPPVAVAVAALAQRHAPGNGLVTRDIELVAPELDHVNETLVQPVSMLGTHFAVMTEAEGYLDKETELGPLAGRMVFSAAPAGELAADRFIVVAPLLVASR